MHNSAHKSLKQSHFLIWTWQNHAQIFSRTAFLWPTNGQTFTVQWNKEKLDRAYLWKLLQVPSRCGSWWRIWENSVAQIWNQNSPMCHHLVQPAEQCCFQVEFVHQHFWNSCQWRWVGSHCAEHQSSHLLLPSVWSLWTGVRLGRPAVNQSKQSQSSLVGSRMKSFKGQNIFIQAKGALQHKLALSANSPPFLPLLCHYCIFCTLFLSQIYQDCRITNNKNTSRWNFQCIWNLLSGNWETDQSLLLHRHHPEVTLCHLQDIKSQEPIFTDTLSFQTTRRFSLKGTPSKTVLKKV